jgi:hypothetical protein
VQIHLRENQYHLPQLAVSGNDIKSTKGSIPEAKFASLLSGVADAISVWYNVTEDVSCLDWKPPNNELSEVVVPGVASPSMLHGGRMQKTLVKRRRLAQANGEDVEKADDNETDNTKRKNEPAAAASAAVHKPAPGPPAPVCKFNKSNKVSSAFSWEPVVCNDQIFLLNTDSTGYGMLKLDRSETNQNARQDE